MSDIITLKDICKDYGKTKVLYNLNLSFEEGSFNSIIGASGSGKTTLLNILGTLDTPTSGMITIDGINPTLISRNRLYRLRNEKIGFVFQFHYLLPEFTALENVLMPTYIKNRKVDNTMLHNANNIMDLVGLGKVKNNLATQMSGGQMQRTAIARALVNNPKVVLADEPTGNLDSEATENIYDLLREINSRFGTTFIIVTHDRRIAEKTDRIIEIKDGMIKNDFKKYK